MENSRTGGLPLQDWSDFIEPVKVELAQLGRRLVDSGRQVSKRAEEVCVNWRLDERRQRHDAALAELTSSVHRVLKALNPVLQGSDPGDQSAAARVIEQELPGIERRYLEVRQFAQDLLHWHTRFAESSGSDAESRYRTAMGQLIAYGPIIKPRLEALQENLLRNESHGGGSSPSAGLLSALTRYLGVVDSSHRFVAAVAEPALELVFEETESFLDELNAIPVETRSPLASGLNDCCQKLLYERPGFESEVSAVPVEFPGQVDGSLFIYRHGEFCVFLTVEEDPLFGRLTVHLLSVVTSENESSTERLICEMLAEQWR